MSQPGLIYRYNNNTKMKKKKEQLCAIYFNRNVPTLGINGTMKRESFQGFLIYFGNNYDPGAAMSKTM